MATRVVFFCFNRAYAIQAQRAVQRMQRFFIRLEFLSGVAVFNTQFDLIEVHRG